MSVRTYRRLAASILILSVLLGSSLAHASDRTGSLAGANWQLSGRTSGGLSTFGDPDGVVGTPPTQTCKKATAWQGSTPVDQQWERQALKAVWSHWFTGLLQHIGYRY